MNPDIERMAKEAGLLDDLGRPLPANPSKLAKFAALMAEECAQECEARGKAYKQAQAPGWQEVDHEASQHAHAIRSRFPMPALSDK